VRRQLPDDWEPFAVPVTFTATLYEPDRSRKRDIVNYAKMVQDVCSRLVYADDHLIDRATWVRGPVDETTPRLEIAVTTLDKSLPRWNT